MNGIFNGFTRKFRKSTLLALAVAAGLAAFTPAVAFGGDRDRDRDHDHDHRHDKDKTEVKVDINFGTGQTQIRRETEYRPRYRERRVRYWVEPVYTVRTERVWVQPVYRTVSERVWVEPVYKTVYEEVRTPARYEVREITRYEHGRKTVTRERTLIDPGGIQRIGREVCVSEGRWDYRVERVEVTGREEETLLDVKF
jgi:hypothetical protein